MTPKAITAVEVLVASKNDWVIVRGKDLECMVGKAGELWVWEQHELGGRGSVVCCFATGEWLHWSPVREGVDLP